MKISKRCLEALKIIGDRKISASEFAQKFWPDSNMHKKVSNQGHGATRGKAAWLCAGSYMGKLKDKGLVKDALWDKYGNYISGSSYKLTEKGKEIIN